MRVYCDTTAWNTILDKYGVRPRGAIKKPEYLVSTANLDEFALAGPKKSRDLARVAWALSSQDVVLDHVAMTAAEMRAAFEPSPLDDRHDHDRRHRVAWSKLRSRGAGPNELAALGPFLDAAKRDYPERSRSQRKFFKSTAEKLGVHGQLAPWPTLLSEMYAEGQFDEFLRGLCTVEPAVFRGLSCENLPSVTEAELACTRCYLEYMAAIDYTAATESGEESRPDYGDQVDLRHATYAALTDAFVTNDTRMKRLLDEFVQSRTAQVYTASEYLATIEGIA